MKKLFRVTLTAALLMCCLFPSQAQHLLLGGSGWRKIAIIEKQTRKVVWEHPLEKGWECNNAVALPDGNILFSYKKGAKVITLEHKDVWDMPTPAGTEMQSVKLLPNGNCLLAWGGSPLTIMEVKAATGEIISKTEYDTNIKNPHAQMRQINKMDDGNYIVPLVSQNVIHIISPKGELIRKVDVAGNPFATEQIKGSRYWVAGGDKHNLLEIDLASGKTLREIKDGDIKNTPLFFIAGIERSKKSVYVCSWQGHAKGKTGPKVLELDKKMRPIWSIDPSDAGIGRVSSVCLIDFK